MSVELEEMIGATVEVMGLRMSGPAIAMLVQDLEEYPLPDIEKALHRVRQDCNRITPAEVIKRLPNMWPGAEQAWATFPRDDSQSACICNEMAAAWGMACELDEISGRMAFKEAYNRAVSERMAEGKKPNWFVSAGTDKEQLKQVVMDSVVDGRLSSSGATAYLPHIKQDELQALVDGRISAGQLLEQTAPTVHSLPHLVEVAGDDVAQDSLEQLKKILNMGDK